MPLKIDAFKGIPIKMIAAGAEHTAVVTENGDLYGWGWGRYGNLGLGDRNDRLIPERVSSSQDQLMVSVACGWCHTITVSSSGNLYTYGWNKYGQLGQSDFEDYLVPCRLEGLKDCYISQISGGWRHTMALTSDGELYGWGWNKFGQLGIGDNTDHCSPLKVTFPDEEKVVQVSCCWRHTLAFTERGNLFSWGRGTNGQLGHGDMLDRNIPTLVKDLSKDGFSCKYLKSSGVLPSSGRTWVSPSDRYAIVPDETANTIEAKSSSSNWIDANVPQTNFN